MSRINVFYLLCGMVLLLCMVMVYGNTSYAKKYYSLDDIGLTGCASDNTDYSIISIRGNQLKYVKYSREKGSTRWKQDGQIRKAKLSSKTKYYMGNSGRLRNRSANLDTSKWISRVRKSTVKKEFSGRSNEIVVARGKVLKLVTGLKR